MKRPIGILLVALLLLSMRADAFEYNADPAKEPTGFRGIEWGQDIATLADMEPRGVKDNGRSQIYARKSDLMIFGGVELDTLLYAFGDGKFSEALLAANGELNGLSLFAAAAALYGKTGPFAGGEYYWFFPRVTISYSYSERDQLAILHYTYNPISEDLHRP
jgi:hypothetical protein